jgi:hypothetical protein
MSIYAKLNIYDFSVQIHMDTPSGFKDCIPAWIKFAVQAPGEIPFNGIYYDPPAEVGVLLVYIVLLVVMVVILVIDIILYCKSWGLFRRSMNSNIPDQRSQLL